MGRKGNTHGADRTDVEPADGRLSSDKEPVKEGDGGGPVCLNILSQESEANGVAPVAQPLVGDEMAELDRGSNHAEITAEYSPGDGDRKVQARPPRRIEEMVGRVVAQHRSDLAADDAFQCRIGISPGGESDELVERKRLKTRGDASDADSLVRVACAESPEGITQGPAEGQGRSGSALREKLEGLPGDNAGETKSAEGVEPVPLIENR